MMSWKEFVIKRLISFVTFYRPVRLAMNFHTNLEMVGKRFPYLANYKVSIFTPSVIM
jgi:hypothetical protein